MTEVISFLNPLKLSKALKESIGDTESAKMLQDGKLLLFCKDRNQQKKALGLKSLMGQKVNCLAVGEKKWMRGVITGIPTKVSEEVIKKSISGASVNEVK